MAALSLQDEAVVHALESTRSVTRTAAELRMPVPQVQRVAMMAFGLGRLDVSLLDF